ncbi:MAG: hydroxymethylglutaryl-CoA lyase [Deltaproteobacteria bacterium]|nr:hydroxymethylglutaryl-CoA lyase [Deltaproteobacteria bacterium]
MATAPKLPTRVSVYEVSPRDGLQNESAQVATHAKVRLIDALLDAGIRRIEVGSFVAQKWVPQMADADEVCRTIDRRPGVTYAGLCPNARGLDRALAAQVDEIAVFVSASETHNAKNVNKTIAQTLKAFDPVIGPAVEQGLKVRGYVSTMWGCPYEGDVDPSRGLELALFTSELPIEQIALHLHDTRGTALANVLVGLQGGITTFDASVAGLGGCPYAPGAAGNLATEDLVYTLHGMGIETGIDLEKLWQAGQVAEAIVGRELPGKVHRAGVRSLAK